MFCLEDDEEIGVLSEGSETSEGGRADTDDEGIERDAEPPPRRRRPVRRFMLKDVIEVSPQYIGTYIFSRNMGFLWDFHSQIEDLDENYVNHFLSRK